MTWGDGTNATPPMYSTLLSHLASWGFTVVASTLQNTGSGSEIDAGAHFMVTENSTPRSPFSGHLNVSEVAAAALTQPAFFISTRGPLDSIIASPATEKAYYASVKGHAALGIIENSGGQAADHNSVQNTASGGHPDGELGYATAWLEYQLRGNASAAAAFSGPTPELAANTNWPGSAVKEAMPPA